MTFKNFADIIRDKFSKISTGILFQLNIDPEILWNLYLDSFESRTNNLYLTHREFDCQNCKRFIVTVGNLVKLNQDLTIETVWDVLPQLEGSIYYKPVEAIKKLLEKQLILGRFARVPKDKFISIESNKSKAGIIWNHLSCEIPANLLAENHLEIYQESIVDFRMLNEAIEMFSFETIEMVISLFQTTSLEGRISYLESVENLLSIKKFLKEEKHNIIKDRMIWFNSLNRSISRIKGSAIGTLLQDIQDLPNNGKSLDNAIESYRQKVDPRNYRRSTSFISELHAQNDLKEMTKLGIVAGLYYEPATLEDIPSEEILFKNTEVKKKIIVTDENHLSSIFSNSKKVVEQTTKDVQRISIQKFVEEILPQTKKIEIFVSNSLTNNFVGILKPKDYSCENPIKWNNRMVHSYIGGLTDSIGEKVKAAGGNLLGSMVGSINWSGYDDLDLHCITPSGKEIYYGSRKNAGGQLDVDMNGGSHRATDPVENIFFDSELSKVPNGRYKFYVHNYSTREGNNGFTFRLSVGEDINVYSYQKEVRYNDNIHCISILKDGTSMQVLELPSHMRIGATSVAAQTKWGINTQKWAEVSHVIPSPNVWEGSGKTHYIFVVPEMIPDEKLRAIYLEFLKPELNKYRKSLEILGGDPSLKVDPTPNGVYGIGFSDDNKNEFRVKITHGHIVREMVIVP